MQAIARKHAQVPALHDFLTFLESVAKPDGPLNASAWCHWCQQHHWQRLWQGQAAEVAIVCPRSYPPPPAHWHAQAQFTRRSSNAR